MDQAGRVVARDRLFDEVWDGEVDIRSNAIDVHMSRLRARRSRRRRYTSRRCEASGTGSRPCPDDRPVRSGSRLVGGRPIVTRLVLSGGEGDGGGAAVPARSSSGGSLALDRQLDQDLEAYQQVVERAVTGTAAADGHPRRDLPDLRRTGAQIVGNRASRRSSTPTGGRAASGDRGPWDLGIFPPAATHPFRVVAIRVNRQAPLRGVRDQQVQARRGAARAAVQLTIADLIALVAASFVGYPTARAALDPVERYRRASRDRGGRPGPAAGDPRRTTRCPGSATP